MKTRRQKLLDDRLLTTRPNTRSKTSANREQNAFPIPDDLTMEIFSRLPVKSIAVCRCVSKQWAAILRRQDFTDSFLAKSSTRPRILFAWRDCEELFIFSAPQIQNPDENSSPLVVNYVTKFTFDGGCYVIDGHVNGLISLIDGNGEQNGKRVTMPVICNPSTGQSVSLPKVKTRRYEAKCYLGYDSIGKQLKVLSMTRVRVRDRRKEQKAWGEYKVMTLGTGRLSWRKIDCCAPRYGYPHQEICINGVLYYTSERTRGTFTLLCFDLRSEKFSSVNFPEAFKDSRKMINCNGKLGIPRFVGGEDSKSIELLVLEDIEKGEWSEQIYALPPLWQEIIGSTTAHVQFVGVIGNEIVLSSLVSRGPHNRWIVPPSPPYLLYFDTKKNNIVRVEIQGMDVYAEPHIFLDHVEDVKLI